MKLILDFILVSGIIITAIVLFLLIKSKKKELPQQVLIIFFLSTLFVSINFYASLHEIIWLFIFSFIPNETISWYIGPLLFLYIKSLFLKKENLVSNTLIHFIPSVFYFIGVTIPILLFEIFNIAAFSYIEKDFMEIIMFGVGDLYLILYLFVSLKMLSKYRETMKSKYSNLTKHDFGWVKTMLIGALLVISIDLCVQVYYSFYSITENWNAEYIVVVAMIVLISYLGYYGVNQSKVLLPDFLLEEAVLKKFNNAKINTLSNTNKVEFETLKNRLDHVLKTNKPYLDEDLTLNKLAKQLATTDKKLSSLLNQYMNTTFYDLINKYRVAVIKEKMQSEAYENYTLLGISYECGFKSKTSFNRIFKKETGLSPSDYKKNLS